MLGVQACDDGQPSVSHLNDTPLAALTVGWDAATLTSLWGEIGLIAPGLQVEQVNLDAETMVLLAADPTNSPGCQRTWVRNLADPAASYPSCDGLGTEPTGPRRSGRAHP